MKPYGLRKADYGCCPGHDKYPTHFVGRYNNMRTNFNHIKKTAKARERRNNKVDYDKIVIAANEMPEDDFEDAFSGGFEEDEFDNIFDCELGAITDDLKSLDGCVLHRDLEAGVFQIKDQKGKLVGKIYFYD